VVAVLGVAGALVSFLFFPLLVSLIVLVGLPFASYYWMIRKGRKRRIALENQLPTVLQLLAGSLDSGASMLHAMEIVAQEGNPPLADEFARVVVETQVGRPMLDSLQVMGGPLRVAGPRLDGGGDPHPVHQWRQPLRDAPDARGVHAGTGRDPGGGASALRGGPLSGKVLTGLPLLVGGFLMLFRRDYVAPLYQTGTGKGMLVAAGFGMLLGRCGCGGSSRRWRCNGEHELDPLGRSGGGRARAWRRRRGTGRSLLRAPDQLRALQSIVGGGIDTRQAELAAPLSQRLLGPVGQSLTKVARKVTHPARWSPGSVRTPRLQGSAASGSRAPWR